MENFDYSKGLKIKKETFLCYRTQYIDLGQEKRIFML
jgi:hypothetical protein